MPVLYHRPDGDQRSVTVSLTSTEWGLLHGKPACLLRFQFDAQYGRDQRFQEVTIEVHFTSADPAHPNPEIINYGPVHIESQPTAEEHVNSVNGQIAVSLPMIEGVETSVGADRQSSWTQQHSGKLQGHRVLQRGSTRHDGLAFQLEEDGRARTGVFKIVRAAAVVQVEKGAGFVVSSEKPWTNPYGWSWTPHNKKLRVNNPVTVPYEDGTKEFERMTAEDWNNMVLLGTGHQLLSNQNLSSSPSAPSISGTPQPEPVSPTLPRFTWSDKHSRWYYQNGSNYVWVQGSWGRNERASFQWQMHPDGQDRYYDGEGWRELGQ